MNHVVLDSSAILALLHREPGAEVVFSLAPYAIVSSVNASEVQSRLVRKGADPKIAWGNIVASVQAIIPFDAAQAESAGSLAIHTQPFGLSLGDRACLALGLATKSPVYTADRAWAQLQVGVDVRLVR
jgi:ribonuclease VapC